MKRREYDLNLIVNDRQIVKVIIDPHYEAKHKESINDEIVLKLVKLLDGGTFPASETKGGFEYYKTDKLKLGTKIYKLIWLLEDNSLYIGVINAYRSR